MEVGYEKLFYQCILSELQLHVFCTAYEHEVAIVLSQCANGADNLGTAIFMVVFIEREDEGDQLDVGLMTSKIRLDSQQLAVFELLMTDENGISVTVFDNQ